MKLFTNFIKLSCILALQTWMVKGDANQENIDQLRGGRDRELASGCCSWDVPNCSRTTNWCNASKSNCERFCRGTYISSGPSPTPPRPSPTPSGRCGCSKCTSSVLRKDARGYSVEARINWVKNNMGRDENGACSLVCGDEFPNICSECDPAKCGGGPSPTPKPPTGPTGGNTKKATTTRYWDCSGGSCGCGFKPPGKSQPAHCPSNGLFNAPRGNQYGAKFYGTAAISASLGGGDWLTGCGKCFKVTGQSNVAGRPRGVTTTLVLKSANYCPAGNRQCEAGPHFDIAAPGFDFQASSLSNNCNKLFGAAGASAYGACENWPGSSCNCNAFSDPTLRAGCENFKSLNWNNPTVDYVEVSCPAELERQNCWEENGGSWPNFMPQFCANN